jgi:hypothetical protein
VETSAEYGVRGKIPAEDFHTTKKFVLVCRSGPAFGKIFYFVCTGATLTTRNNPQFTDGSYFVTRHFL